MFNPWSWAHYPEKRLTRPLEEKAIRQVGRLILTETQITILCDNGYQEKFRLDEITALQVHKKSGAKHPAFGFIFGLTLVLFFVGFGYNFIPGLTDPKNPIVVGSGNGKLAGLILTAILGFTAAGIYLLYFAIAERQWWWLALTASGQTYHLPLAKTKDIKEQDLLTAISELKISAKR